MNTVYGMDMCTTAHFLLKNETFRGFAPAVYIEHTREKIVDFHPRLKIPKSTQSTLHWRYNLLVFCVFTNNIS